MCLNLVENYCNMCYKKMFNVHNLMPIQIQRFIDLQIYILITCKIKDITTINIVLKYQLHLYARQYIDLVTTNWHLLLHV